MTTWPYPLLKLGMERLLEEADLPEIAPVDTSAENRIYLQKIWKDECKRHPEKPSLHRAILRDYFCSIWYVQPLMFATTICKVVQALALGKLVESFDEENDDRYIWAGVLVACASVVLFEHHHVFFITWRKGTRLRIASVASI